MKFKLLALTALVIFLSFTSPVLARKRLVRSTSGPGSTGSVWVKPMLRSDHNALILAFGNLNLAENLSYLLTYSNDSVPQGVEGNHQPTTNNFQTEFLWYLLRCSLHLSSKPNRDVT